MKEVPIPKITEPEQVLIKVSYAAVNPIDWKVISGLLGPVSIRKPAHIPGFDFSGQVIAKGGSKDLDYLCIGDMVFGNCTGSFAEYMVAPAAQLTKMPDCISPQQAAAIPLVTQTSFQALQQLRVQKGEKILIFGGSTSTGLMATQIAKHHLGCAEVIVTSSQEELCKKSGADRVINYKTEKWEVILKDYGLDAIYDCVGGVDYWNLCRSEGVLKKNGRFATIVGDTEHVAQVTVGSMVGMGLSIANRKFWGSVGYQSYDFILNDAKKNIEKIAAMVEGGKLNPVLDPDSPYQFEDFLKMFEKSMSHRAKGKLVIQIGGDSKAKNDADASSPSDDVKEEEQDEPKQEQESGAVANENDGTE